MAKKVKSKQSKSTYNSDKDLFEDDFQKLDFKITTPNLTPKQKVLLKICMDENTKVVFIQGPAGTSKTTGAMIAALKLLKEDNDREITYVRTLAESAEIKVGFLPGDVTQKTKFHMAPIEDKLDDLVDLQTRYDLLAGGHINTMVINFIRGQDWKNKVIVADEMQNATVFELETLLTRIAIGTKMFLCGDTTSQSDIGRKTGYKDFCRHFDTPEYAEKGIHVFSFGIEDIMRSEILKILIQGITEIKEAA